MASPVQSVEGQSWRRQQAAVLGDTQRVLEKPIADGGGNVRPESSPTVDGDVSQLRQPFVTLLSNAIKYTGDELAVVYVTEEQRTDGIVAIAVREEHIGTDRDCLVDGFERRHGADGAAICPPGHAGRAGHEPTRSTSIRGGRHG